METSLTRNCFTHGATVASGSARWEVGLCSFSVRAASSVEAVAILETAIEC